MSPLGRDGPLLIVAYSRRQPATCGRAQSCGTDRRVPYRAQKPVPVSQGSFHLSEVEVQSLHRSAFEEYLVDLEVVAEHDQVRTGSEADAPDVFAPE